MIGHSAMSSVRKGMTLAPHTLLSPPRANDGLPSAPSWAIGIGAGSRYGNDEPYAIFNGIPPASTLTPSRMNRSEGASQLCGDVDRRCATLAFLSDSRSRPASSIVTRAPCWSRACAQATPAGPEPTTTNIWNAAGV